jgi:hypothetical protein
MKVNNSSVEALALADIVFRSHYQIFKKTPRIVNLYALTLSEETKKIIYVDWRRLVLVGP